MALKLHQISWFFSTLFGDELFGSEGIKQVFGLLTDFFDNLKDKDAVTHLLYDDMCHLKKHSENPEVAELNEVTEKISKLEKSCEKIIWPSSSSSVSEKIVSQQNDDWIIKYPRF